MVIIVWYIYTYTYMYRQSEATPSVIIVSWHHLIHPVWYGIWNLSQKHGSDGKKAVTCTCSIQAFKGFLLQFGWNTLNTGHVERISQSLTCLSLYLCPFWQLFLLFPLFGAVQYIISIHFAFYTGHLGQPGGEGGARLDPFASSCTAWS